MLGVYGFLLVCSWLIHHYILLPGWSNHLELQLRNLLNPAVLRQSPLFYQ